MAKFYLYLSRFTLILLVFAASSAFGQTKTVTGKVTSSDDGAPLPGVNVQVKGSNTGTVTDVEGNYSISVTDNSVLVFSFVGYASQEVTVGSQSQVNISLGVDVTALSEVIVVGYGSQEKKEITSAVTTLGTSDFNLGNVNDPIQLLQGKVAGLSIYNKGGNPNSGSVIRMRGLSTVGANVQPLIVVDGVIGASLDNVDPNDIESVNVLKDGSAAAIYGSRGSSGVIIVTTKKGGGAGALSLSYNGYLAAATIAKEVPNMDAGQYVNAGGNDLGSNTDWIDEVTRTGISNVHNIAVAGRNETTSFRLSTNYRNVQGILAESGFEQINLRSNLNHKALDGKLNIDLGMSMTNKESNFSFNEALRYAVLFNPTAPIKFEGTDDYYQAILFDNFNPAAIINQNINEGRSRVQNYNLRVDYSITNELSVTATYSQQFETVLNGEYYSRASLWRGFNNGGLARRYTNDREFSLFESYGTYSKNLGKVNFDATLGYSYQADQFEDVFIEVGDFPSDELGYHILETSGDRLLGASSGSARAIFNSNISPENKIIAFFGRVNLTFDNAIFFNASLRREGSSKLGKDQQWGLFPSVGAGVDITKYISMGNAVSALKFRVGYGVTGSLPNASGLSQDLYNYSTQDGGTVTFARNANPDLKWEEKAETNVGVDFGLLSGKLTGALDVYTRTISDFILEIDVSPTEYASGRRTENVGELKTNGIELTLNYAATLGQVQWTPGIVLSSYKTTLEEFISPEAMRANLGSPGQNSTNMVRIAVGEEIGQIWGPVFDGVLSGDDPRTSYATERAGDPRMKDLNGDGIVLANQGSALAADGDFQNLGNGIPKMEIGWTNQVKFKNWDLNVFFRGAFGHSLVNNFRAFYEPIDPGAINSYNRITTDKEVDGLTSAQFSSLYVEKAGFFRCDNLTLGYNFKSAGSSVFRSLRVYGTVQNLFTITDYTGLDPEPVLVDYPSTDNGGFTDVNAADVLSPGIDRRNNYFTARTFTVGVTIGL